MEVGVRVIRGPDWCWGQQDGGEGHTGTVAEVLGGQGGGPPDSVVIQWDCGGRCKYRCGGKQGKYDLSIVDTAPAGRAHPRKTCTWCDVHPILGMVWMCAYCYDYCLCTDCYMLSKHSLDHPFDRCMTRDYKKRVRVPPRFLAEKVPLMGMFPEAVVVRGHDWRWSNQDGGNGNKGHVIKVQGWKDETFRSVAVVKWGGAQTNNVYRRGHHGKVDLRCAEPAGGGECYTDHLPLLGYEYPEDQDVGVSAGDSVAVFLDPDLFKAAQGDYGGWNDGMAEHIGQTCVVLSVYNDLKKVFVQYSNGQVYALNRDIVTKVDVPLFGFGDVVRVIEDMGQVYSLQSGHGEWNDDMALSLGQVGRVVLVNPGYDVSVCVNGRRWTFNPKCLVPAPEEVPIEVELDSSMMDPNLYQRVQLLSLTSAPNVVPAATVLGDAKTLRDYLDKNPHAVNFKGEDKCPLYLAVIKGHHSVVKLLLKYNPDLESKDETGETPLHVAARVDDVESAKLLLQAGADVNAKEQNGYTPIILASALDHCRVLEELCSTHSANLNFQCREGETALHKAVGGHHTSTRVLLRYGADPALKNSDFFTPLHLASRVGHYSGVEEIICYHPDLINVKKEDGFTPLHLAAVNNHVDIATLLVSHPSCSINALNSHNHTPLHAAIVRGHVAVVERLVGFGAHLNAITLTGNTPLHEALKTSDMTPPSNETPEIKKIQNEIEAEHTTGVVSANIVVGLFLVANGADIHLKNMLGQSACSMCSADHTSLLNKYSGRQDSFHGSFKNLPHSFTDPPKSIKKQNPPITSSPLPAPNKPHTDSHLAPPTSQSPPTLQHSKSTPAPANSASQTSSSGNQGVHEKSEVVQAMEQVMNLLPEVALSDVTTPDKKGTPELFWCLLCEDMGADIKMAPCGHVSMCHVCAPSGKSVKKCLECMGSVTDRKAVCVLCHREEISRTLTPCGHTYCSDCGTGLDICKACRSSLSEP